MLKTLRNIALILSLGLVAVIAYDYRYAQEVKTVKSKAKVKSITQKEFSKLPASTEIKGDITIDKANFDTLPQGMKVDGNMTIYVQNPVEVTRGQVYGNVKVVQAVRGTPDVIKEIDHTRNIYEKAKTRSDLWKILLKSFPKNQKIADDDFLVHKSERLNLKPQYAAQVQKNPLWYDGNEQDVESGQKLFAGNLDIDGSKMKYLPQGLRVGGNLYMRNTNIEHIPADIQVSGNIYIYGSPIKNVATQAAIGGQVLNSGDV
jgi:hypothetical protein